MSFGHVLRYHAAVCGLNKALGLHANVDCAVDVEGLTQLGCWDVSAATHIDAMNKVLTLEVERETIYVQKGVYPFVICFLISLH